MPGYSTFRLRLGAIMSNYRATAPRDCAPRAGRSGAVAQARLRRSQAQSGAVANPWVKEGEPICPRCHWPTDSQGHVANCEEPA
jgi:hypothetical protein